MKDIEIPDPVFETEIVCSSCETSFVVETTDLEVDKFKKPGTYWYDGSADAAGLSIKYFVVCPACNRFTVIPTGDIPFLLQQKLIATLQQ